MNLHGIVRGAIRHVTPDLCAQLYPYEGATQGTDGKRHAVYSGPILVMVQVQSMGNELHQQLGLNLDQISRAVYLQGNWHGVIRADQQGGDRMTFSVPGIRGNQWQIVRVLESWPDWTKVAVCLQRS